MQVFDVKVVLSKKNNCSNIQFPKEVSDKFTNNGQEDAILLYLPFRHSAVLKSLGITKEEFLAKFEKSGLACSLLTLNQFYDLIYQDLPMYCKGDKKLERRFVRYFCSNAMESKTGKFIIPDNQKCNFVSGSFKVVLADNGNRTIAEVFEDSNVKKIAELLKTAKKKRRVDSLNSTQKTNLKK